MRYKYMATKQTQDCSCSIYTTTNYSHLEEKRKATTPEVDLPGSLFESGHSENGSSGSVTGDKGSRFARSCQDDDAS